MDDIIRDPHHLPSEGIRLPERGFGIDRRKALLAAAICWTSFAIMVWLVLTGRNMPPQLIAMADEATECEMVKHPISQGIFGRWGVEY